MGSSISTSRIRATSLGHSVAAGQSGRVTTAESRHTTKESVMNARVKRVSLTWGVVIGLLLILATPLVVGAHAQAAPTLEVVSPADGATITANDIQVQLKVSDLNLDCAAFGRPDRP